MNQQLSPEQLKARLQELIDVSEALKTMPEEERNARIQVMLNAPAEKMLEIVKVLEEEQVFLKQAKKDLNEHADEVAAYMEESAELEQKDERAKRVEKEKALRVADDKHAEMLLKKLDDIV